MANFYRFLILVFLFFPALASAQVWTGTGPAPAGYIDLAGWIKNADGTSSRAFSDGNGTRSIPNNNTVSVTSNALVNTSKGQHLMEINKTAAVDVNRMGAVVAKFAKRVGPVGMAIGTASLICELSDICNVDGIFNKITSPNGVEAIKTHVGWCVNNGGSSPCYSDKDFDAAVLQANSCLQQTNSNCQVDGVRELYTNSVLVGLEYRFRFISDGSYSQYFPASFMGTYTPPPPTSAPATEADWDAKQPLLNDPRFTPDLEAAKEEIPTGIPTLTPGQKKELGVESTPTKDPQGNITGREDTITELEPIDAGTADKPGLVIIKETKTTVKYDNNNTQISTTTNTSYSSQPQPEAKPTEFEIKFDGVELVELPTHNVPNTYASTSWGDGSCPPDIDLDLIHGQFTIPTSPVCDTAEKVNPFILVLAALASIYIVSGVRTSNT